MKKRILLLLMMISQIFLLQTTEKNLELLQTEITPPQEQSSQITDAQLVPLDPPTGNVRPIAEFEQMEGVLIGYPLGIPIEFVALMSVDTTVYTIVSQSFYAQCQSYFETNGVNLNNVEFIIAETDSYWTTDYGPWFIAHDNQVEIVDFTYDRPRPFDNVIPGVIANYWDVPYYFMNMLHNGGNFMCDGNSVAASTNYIYEENTNLTITQIHDYVQSYLGIDNYHVTIDPLGAYIQHINCWGKFLDVDKILIGQVPITDERYADYEFVADYFAAQTSAWGNHYQVFRVYAPGGTPTTPYTNSLILNNRVYVPTTGSQWDDEALDVYGQAMPGYEIVSVYSTGWLNTDGLRCRTYGMADRNMLYIEHYPLLGELEVQEQYSIQADIISYGNAYIYPESLLVSYQINDSDFVSVNMISQGGDTYSADIPGQVPGTSVKYYIHAADANGKSANHPFIGAADPHDFTVAYPPLPPELIIDPDSIHIELSQNQIAVSQLKLSNGGELELHFNISEFLQWLELDCSGGTITGGDSIIIALEFDTNGLGAGEYSGVIAISDNWEENLVPVTLTVTGLGNNEVVGNAIGWLSCYPNPFNPETTISFSVTQSSVFATLEIFNIKGQKVKTLMECQVSAGDFNCIWKGRDDNDKRVSSGTYIARLKLDGEETATRKIMLLK
ncbi:MAG TPA: agmatine deiminase family protein [Candidatus Cloacimonadota bacterium]|nr:agmatine deiminase family protein [Candidatus Cloacimonadota bacterium]